MFQITQLLSTSKSHQSLAHCWTTAVAAADVRLFFHHSFRLSSDHTRVVAPISPAQSPSQRPRPPRPPSPSRRACAASRRSWCSARTCTDDDRVQIDIKWLSDKGVRANKANLDLKWIHTRWGYVLHSLGQGLATVALNLLLGDKAGPNARKAPSYHLTKEHWFYKEKEKVTKPEKRRRDLCRNLK